MTAFFLGLVALLLVLFALDRFAKASPAALAWRIKKATGVAALAASGALLLRGMGGLAIPLGMAGVWLLWGGGAVLPWPSGGGSGAGGAGGASQSSRIRTATLDLELDHETGDLSGRVVGGAFAGRAIQSLAPIELAELWRDCRFSDPQSASILEAWLDRIHPSWRDDMRRSAAEGDTEPQPSAANQPMTREEAFSILGIAPGASAEAIRTAHRELMMKLHPDLGGSNWLAAKINQAKDLLLP